MGSEESTRSPIRELAHELRDALSPLASAADLARLRGFDADSSRLLADKVERGLRRTRAILDAFVLAEQYEVGAEERTAPAGPPAPSPGVSRPPAPTDASGVHSILIVDDSLEVRRSYREVLGALGYTVTEAGDAEQALQALESSAPDVALIDIHLPRMSGYRLAQTIRSRAGAPIHLVMLCGTTLDAATRKLAREAGFDECLDKMAGPIALRRMIASAAAPKP